MTRMSARLCLLHVAIVTDGKCLPDIHISSKRIWPFVKLLGQRSRSLEAEMLPLKRGREVAHRFNSLPPVWRVLLVYLLNYFSRFLFRGLR